MERLWRFELGRSKNPRKAQKTHRLFIELQFFRQQGRRHRPDSHSLRSGRRLRKMEPPLLDHFARSSTRYIGTRNVLILHREALTHTWARKHVRHATCTSQRAAVRICLSRVDEGVAERSGGERLRAAGGSSGRCAWTCTCNCARGAAGCVEHYCYVRHGL
jgi:hypothetical protein